MSKIITDQEMGEIIYKATHDPGIIDDNDSYLHFLRDLAGLITTHFGGTHSEPVHTDNELGYCVAFQVNECVPADGGIFSEYDPDVKWKDGKEIEVVLSEHDTVSINSSTCEDEMVTHNFTGTIILLHKDGKHAIVEDQDNNVFTVNIKSITKE